MFYEVSPGLWVCLRYFALVMGLLDEDWPKLCMNFGFQCSSNETSGWSLLYHWFFV